MLLFSFFVACSLLFVLFFLVCFVLFLGMVRAEGNMHGL